MKRIHASNIYYGYNLRLTYISEMPLNFTLKLSWNFYDEDFRITKFNIVGHPFMFQPSFLCSRQQHPVTFCQAENSRQFLHHVQYSLSGIIQPWYVQVLCRRLVVFLVCISTALIWHTVGFWTVLGVEASKLEVREFTSATPFLKSQTSLFWFQWLIAHMYAFLWIFLIYW